MAGKNFRVVPKINGNLIGLFIVMPSTGQCRQVALIECPTDDQMNDNVELAETVCNAYRKRIRKSV